MIITESPPKSHPAPTMPSTDVQRQRTIRKRAPAARWSDKEIETLLAGVLDAKDNGLRSENGFKSSVWSSLAAGFGDPLKKANRVCESKWARLKGDYRAVKFLRNLSGFGWDATKSLVTAESGVWEELAQVLMILLHSLTIIIWKLNNCKTEVSRDAEMAFHPVPLVR